MHSVSQLRLKLLLGLLVGLLSGCSMFSGLGGPRASADKIFFIDPEIAAPVAGTGRCGDLLVGEINSAPGFRGARMAYTTTPLKLNYYAHSRWASAFGRLLTSPLQQGLQNSGNFTNVLASPTIAASDVRLEFSDLNVLQKFASPEATTSTMTLSVQARLVKTQPLALLDNRRFEVQSPAAPNPAGGAIAANELAARLIREITEFAGAACTALPGRQERPDTG